MSVSDIPKDKLLHFGVGTVAYGGTLALSLAGLVLFKLDPKLAPHAALGVVLALAIGKEFYDATGRGHVEVNDFLATLGGGLVPHACLLVGKAIA